MATRYSREDISGKGDNIYAVVRTLAKRAIELARGGTPLILKPESKNPANIALEELMSDKIKVNTKTSRDDRVDNIV